MSFRDAGAPAGAGAPRHGDDDVREMGMTYWLEKAEGEMRELG